MSAIPNKPIPELPACRKGNVLYQHHSWNIQGICKICKVPAPKPEETK